MSTPRKLFHNRDAKELKVGEAMFLRDAEKLLGSQRVWVINEFLLPVYDLGSRREPDKAKKGMMRFTKTIVRTGDGATVWVWQRTE